MPAAPRYKVFDDKGNYVASAKSPAIGVATAMYLGTDATVRDGYRVKDTIFKTPLYSPGVRNLVQDFANQADTHAAPLGPVREVVSLAADA